MAEEGAQTWLAVSTEVLQVSEIKEVDFFKHKSMHLAAGLFNEDNIWQLMPVKAWVFLKVSDPVKF